MRLTPHFTLEEMTYSNRALEEGIDNTLSITNDDHLATIRRLTYVCETVLEPARKHYGKPIIPSSGFRCPALNVVVGGSPTSQHMKGEAVDFEVPGVSNIELVYWLAGNIALYDQIILEHYDEDDPAAGWAHIAVMEGRGRMERRTIGATVSALGLPPLTLCDK